MRWNQLSSDAGSFTRNRLRRAGLVLVAGGVIAGIGVFRLAEARGAQVGVAVALAYGLVYVTLGRAMVVTRGQLTLWLSPQSEARSPRLSLRPLPRPRR